MYHHSLEFAAEFSRESRLSIDSCTLQHQQQGQLISTASQQCSGLSPLLAHMHQAYKVSVQKVFFLQNFKRRTDIKQARQSILDGVLESKANREARHPVSLPL